MRRGTWGSWSRLVLGDRRDPRRVLAEQFDVAVPSSGSPPREALEWARATLRARQVEASEDPMNAIRILRDQKPLGLKTTVYLVQHLRRGR